MTLFGVPATILTDRDEQWKSKFLATHGTTSKGRPKSVGKTLCAFFVNHQHDWRERLPTVEFAINSAADKTTGFSPSEIAFGRKIRPSNSKLQKSQAITVAYPPSPTTSPSDQACSVDTFPTARLPFPDPVVRTPDTTDKFCHLKLRLARSLKMVAKFKTDLQAASDTIQDLKSRNELLEIESTQRFNACVTAQHEIGRLTDLETSFKKSNQGLIDLLDSTCPIPGNQSTPPPNLDTLEQNTVAIAHHPTFPTPYLRKRPSHQRLVAPSADSAPSSPGSWPDRLTSIHPQRVIHRCSKGGASSSASTFSQLSCSSSTDLTSLTDHGATAPSTLSIQCLPSLRLCQSSSFSHASSTDLLSSGPKAISPSSSTPSEELFPVFPHYQFKKFHTLV
ncbi:hypothetical protein PSTT_11147 [Puccinia striiformis]|uniref:Integrase catalytic domain-containing protein n=1 Tax=Puccinia striiformis TaxID=27350 RepID=A0A2S4V1C4_9BASI|nr:hypothetical protein PSTT_11147 [Puccinia striiformis]